jgi:L-ascorbate metabolism protein UlaG (beta-lactamase superfamily)
MRITYVGHATVQLEAAGLRLLTDPVLRERVGHLRRIVPLGESDGLRAPDVVVISHAHFDHLDVPSLRRLRPCPVIAPRGCARLLSRAGLRDVTEARPGQQLWVGAMELTPIEVAHDGRRHPFSRARQALAYVTESPERVLFAGDTDVFDGMGDLGGELDAALLPIWGWGPRVGKGHMDPVRAARAVELIKPRVAVPIHWGTLASPRAPWLGDAEGPARAFAERVAAATPGVEVRVLRPGETTEVTAAAELGSEAE